MAFDRRVVSTLFPKFEHAVNSLSGGSKQRVQNLYKVLSSLENESRLRHKFYAVTDSDNVYQSEGQRHFSWDVYHIENYLLEGDFLFRVLERLRSCTIETGSAEKVRSCLKECAKISVSALINHRLTVEVNSALLKSITFKISSVDGDPTRALAAAIQKASEKAAVLAAQTYPVSEIESRFRAVSLEVRSSLDNESWMKTFRGRDILKLFVTKYVSGISYQNLRELILSEMKDNGYQPAGMKAIVDRIMAD